MLQKKKCQAASRLITRHTICKDNLNILSKYFLKGLELSKINLKTLQPPCVSALDKGHKFCDCKLPDCKYHKNFTKK